MTNPADMVPFARTMGIKITEMTADRAHAEMLVRPEICTAGNGQDKPSIHGGAVMTLADVVGAFGGWATPIGLTNPDNAQRWHAGCCGNPDPDCALKAIPYGFF